MKEKKTVVYTRTSIGVPAFFFTACIKYKLLSFKVLYNFVWCRGKRVNYIKYRYLYRILFTGINPVYKIYRVENERDHDLLT